MDGIIPVGAEVQPPDLSKGMGFLSSILGVQQQQVGLQQAQQNLQTGQYLQQSAQAQAQQQQQTAKQRAGIAGIDWSKYDDGTGVISTDKMLEDKDLQAKTGDQFLDVVKAGAAARQNQLQNKQELVKLNNDMRDQFGSMLGALRTDPDIINDTPAGRAKVDAAISRFSEAGGPDAQRVAKIYAPVTQAAPKGGLERGIQAIQLQAMDASRQAAAQAPSYISAGGTLPQINPLAAGGAKPGNLGVSLAPTQRPEYLGQVANVAGDADRYNQISAGAQDARSIQSLSRQVSALADQVHTGKLSKEFANTLTVLQQQSPGITARQMLGKYAAQLKTMVSKNGTDQENAAVREGMPDPDNMDPDAIKEASDYIGGMGAMRAHRGAIADRYVQQNKGTNGIRAADDQYMRNADPFVYMYRQLPAGQARQEFILKHFAGNPAGAKQFAEQKKAVEQYGQ